MWISLIGFMGSGKSSVGRIAADRLLTRCIDLDDEIVDAAGRSIPDIFARDGLAGFRDLERTALATLDGAGDGVLACGGGIVELEPNRRHLRELGTVVWLDAPWEILRARLEPTVNERPLIRELGWDGLEELFLRRRPLYAATAHFRLRADLDDAETTARRVMACRGGAAAGKEESP